MFQLNYRKLRTCAEVCALTGDAGACYSPAKVGIMPRVRSRATPKSDCVGATAHYVSIALALAQQQAIDRRTCGRITKKALVRVSPVLCLVQNSKSFVTRFTFVFRVYAPLAP